MKLSDEEKNLLDEFLEWLDYHGKWMTHQEKIKAFQKHRSELTTP